MKKFIITLAVLALVACGIYKGIQFLNQVAHEMEEQRNLTWALYHEKNARTSAVLAEAITTLEIRLEEIETKSGVKARSFMYKNETPAIFRYRLDQLNYVEWNKDSLLNEINAAMLRVIVFNNTADAYPGALPFELINHYHGAHNRQEERNKKIEEDSINEYKAFIDAQKSALEKIEALSAADVPEHRIAWQRELSKSRK